MVLSSSDPHYLGKPLHPNRIVSVEGGTITQLTGAVTPPPPHGAIALERQGMALASGDRTSVGDGVGADHHLNWGVSLQPAAVSQLTPFVETPTPDGIRPHG